MTCSESARYIPATISPEQFTPNACRCIATIVGRRKCFECAQRNCSTIQRYALERRLELLRNYPLNTIFLSESRIERGNGYVMLPHCPKIGCRNLAWLDGANPNVCWEDNPIKQAHPEAIFQCLACSGFIFRKYRL